MVVKVFAVADGGGREAGGTSIANDGDGGRGT